MRNACKTNGKESDTIQAYLKRVFERDFIKRVSTLALPIALQALIASSVNLLDVVMIGSLGDASIAAAGAANQVFFVLTLILFGVNSGAAVFISQFWGKEDVRNVRRSMGMMLIGGLVISTVFTLGATILPRTLIGFYADDPEVIALGADYLFIVGISYIPTAICFLLSTACRSTGQVKLPLFTSISSIIINVVGNAILIFGLLGAPRMGIRGAALSTLIARVVEMILLIFFIYKLRLPAATKLRELFDFDRVFVGRFIRTSAPVLLNEALWSVGTTLYSVAYGRLGTHALAAVQITSTVFQLFNVFTRGVSDAAAIMIGQRIGAGEEMLAKDYSKRFMLLVPLIGSVLCILMILARPRILAMYNVTEMTHNFANTLLLLQAIVMIPKSINLLIIVGICRSGGDTLFSCILDTATVWLAGVPLAFLAVYLGFPLWAVYLCVSSEEVFKLLFGIPRVLSGKWVNNVVSHIQEENTA